jgi:hypothetical protein
VKLVNPYAVYRMLRSRRLAYVYFPLTPPIKK